MTRKVVFFVTFCSAAWRVFGGEHPLTAEIEKSLQKSRATLRGREDRDDESLDDADDTE